MSVEYTPIESAVVARLISYFSELDTNNCKAGYLDQVIEDMFSNSRDYGVWIEYGGSNKRNREPFKSPIWTHMIEGVFFIRYHEETIEQTLRVIIDKLLTFLDEDHTLGGVSPLVEIVRIPDPEPLNINDVPFYWVYFEVEALAK